MIFVRNCKGSTKGNIASNEENLLGRWGSGDEYSIEALVQNVMVSFTSKNSANFSVNINFCK